MQSKIILLKLISRINKHRQKTKYSIDYQKAVKIFYACACNKDFQKMKQKNIKLQKYSQHQILETIAGSPHFQMISIQIIKTKNIIV